MELHVDEIIIILLDVKKQHVRFIIQTLAECYFRKISYTFSTRLETIKIIIYLEYISVFETLFSRF